MYISGISQLLLTLFGLNFKGKVKARSRQYQSNVKAGSRQGKGKVMAMSKPVQEKVKARSRGKFNNSYSFNEYQINFFDHN